MLLLAACLRHIPAVAQMIQQEIGVARQVTFRKAANRYFADIVPTKKPRTQDSNKIELEFLYQIFDTAPVPLPWFGLTDAPNPAQGVRKNEETGRDTYIKDDVYQLIWKAACQPLRDAMDLAYLAPANGQPIRVDSLSLISAKAF